MRLHNAPVPAPVFRCVAEGQATPTQCPCACARIPMRCGRAGNADAVPLCLCPYSGALRKGRQRRCSAPVPAPVFRCVAEGQATPTELKLLPLEDSGRRPAPTHGRCVISRSPMPQAASRKPHGPRPTPHASRFLASFITHHSSLSTPRVPVSPRLRVSPSPPHILSGHFIPSTSSPLRITVRRAETSSSRACVRSRSSLITRCFW